MGRICNLRSLRRTARLLRSLRNNRHYVGWRKKSHRRKWVVASYDDNWHLINRRNTPMRRLEILCFLMRPLTARARRASETRPHSRTLTTRACQRTSKARLPKRQGIAYGWRWEGRMWAKWTGIQRQVRRIHGMASSWRNWAELKRMIGCPCRRGRIPRCQGLPHPESGRM